MDKTSYRIMKRSEFIDHPEPVIYYKADCACGSSECSLILELEYDKYIGDISLTIYNDLAYCSWWYIKNETKFYFFKDIYRRVKGALKLLFTGKIRLEGNFIFSDIDQIDAFINALEEGKKKLLE